MDIESNQGIRRIPFVRPIFVSEIFKWGKVLPRCFSNIIKYGEPPRCPAAPLRCSRAPWPGPRRAVGSPGHGAAWAVRSVSRGASRELPGRAEGWQAGGVVPAAIPAAAARPGSRHHEHRRGVPQPAQLPLEQAAGQREAGTEAGDPVPPCRHLLARFWAHSRPRPR